MSNGESTAAVRGAGRPVCGLLGVDDSKDDDMNDADAGGATGDGGALILRREVKDAEPEARVSGDHDGKQSCAVCARR